MYNCTCQSSEFCAVVNKLFNYYRWLVVWYVKMLHVYVRMMVSVRAGAYEPPKAARSVQLRIIAQNGICIYSST